MHKHSIRNICIIAHIDHGKSTLADRFIEHADLATPRNFHPQFLDSMDIERERGITIKSRAITIPYSGVHINIIDTPGHVDFTYEVSRAIASCEGALLIVDATQGVQAQTLSNLYLALEYDLEIIPVINKIDCVNAEVDRVTQQITKLTGIDPAECLSVSAKHDIHVDKVLDALIHRVPAPDNDTAAPLRARLFDSYYDSFRGVILSLRIVDGILTCGDKINGWAGEETYRVEEVGVFGITPQPVDCLRAGNVGYCIANIKSLSALRVGDTIIASERPAKNPLSGFKRINSAVYSSIFPIESDQHNKLRSAIEKLQLNDSALVYEPESSEAMGNGFRCGFLGLLHLEIVQERLEREFDLGIILTPPSVRYECALHGGEIQVVRSIQEFPDNDKIISIHEPYVRNVIITPHAYLGGILQLCADKRGTQKNINYLDEQRVELEYEIPLAEMIFEFYDSLKSVSSGYASCDYELIDYRQVDLIKVDILVGGNIVEALSFLSHRAAAERRARHVCAILKEKIPRHQFAVAIQAAINGAIIVRETVSALRKDVTAKLYGGDITRKKKLLEKQKKGKKRLKTIGNVHIPKEVFLSALRTRQ